MRSLMIAASLLALAGAASAAPAEGPSRKFEGRDLFSLEWASDPQISPNGRLVAYVRNANDVMTDRARRSIWLVDADTGAQTPLVAGAGSHASPRWSPDGKRLAYVSSAEGGAPQLFVRWMADGSTARLTGLPDSPGQITWSPDGKTIAYTLFEPSEGAKLGSAPAKPEGAKWADPLQVIDQVSYRADGAGYLKPGYTHVYLISADGGAARQLTFGAYDDGAQVSWTPDGKYLLLSGNRAAGWEREPVNTEVYQVAVADGSVTALTSRAGPDNQPAVSPDGRQVAYLGFDDQYLGYQNTRLYVMDRDGKNPRVLTGSLDRSVGDPQWAADGKSIYVQYADHGATKVARVSLDGRIQTVAEGLAGGGLDRPYSGGEFSVANDGAIAFTSGSAYRPSDISVMKAGKARRLTQLNENLFAGKTLGEVRPLKVASSFDGKPVDSWLVLPPNFDPAKKYPLILEIHGGPFSSYGPSFATDMQLYAAAGYVVLYTNPRGSTSYGEEFANLIHHAYPGHDYDDLMSAVDAAIATGSVNPDELFVTGGSGGGVLTAWIVGKTDRFTAAATQKPVINWSSMTLTADSYTYFAKYWFGKLPWEDPQGYWARSPLSLVGNVKTPTLVVVGGEDYRTPVSESEQYYQALQLRGVPTALVKVPGVGHGAIASRPSQSAAKASAILAWFDRYRAKAEGKSAAQ
ncbi:S9 family peptidase [Caulobacter sp. 17J65-9]|uniref:alpha/beta hydrolase family protein n=1 Tax=Caulobacter sp. 17J65-9 TaxID=2709382 RepID=UPI0013CB154B|nr:S9 family peptidase [Caulobacter sp. 17J65-9]NEX91731.1 S9 family peptidase [Caulobacter sp. 17J65-9]